MTSSPQLTPSRSYTRAQVREHTANELVWLIIDSIVYDVTDFLDAHPGGASVLHQVAGQDATDIFYNLHRHEILSQYARLSIGTIDNEKPQIIVPSPGDRSPIAYAEPLWLTTPFKSPYYCESHHRLRRAAREFMQRYVAP